MDLKLGKYVGHTVDIVYIDGRGRITKRAVQVRAVQGGVMKAFCLHRRAPRRFRTDHILAAMPVRPASVSGRDAG
ncbi:hypothetical protein [Paenibacillus hamazuiensis]|uniref:hypothetical protein n=1 Tax=Paenibacillus hamazuiensis TaxID=2936508 RepID=UPI00200CAF93|nr:hypothetical protein [Paenibacillus hamazuiensis]